MQIQLGNFGNAIAQPQQAAQVVPQQAANQGLANVAQAGQQLAATFQAVDEQKQRMQAVSSLASLNNDLHDIHDSIARDVAGGVIKPENALDAFNARAADARKARTDGLNPFQQETIDSHITTAVGSLTRNLQGVAIKKTESDIGAQILDTGESLQRQAMRDLPTAIAQYDALAETMGPKAGWNSIQIAKAKQGFKESASFNFANATLEGAAQTGDKALVQAALDKIQGPDGEMIDPHKRTSLITKAYGYLNGIDAATQRDADRAAREQQARENAAVTALDKAQELADNGRYMSTEQINDLAEATAGTNMAKQAQELVKSQSMVAGFASLPLPQMRATVERINAAGSDPRDGVTPDEQKVAVRYKNILTASERAYKENPWQAAQERGVIKDAPIIRMNSIQDIQQGLGERMSQIGQVEIAAGRKVSPLQPLEAETLLSFLQTVPIDVRAQALNGIGAAIGSAGRISDLAKQWNDKDPSMALALKAGAAGGAGGPLVTTSGTPLSAFILSGAQAIKDKTVKVDDITGSGVRSQIATAINGVLPPEQEQDAKETAYYVAVGAAARNGRSTLSSTDIQNGINAATGGISNTGGTKFDGTPNRVAMPYGWTDDQFQGAVKAAGIGNIENTINGAPVHVVYAGGQEIPAAEFMSKMPSYKLMRVGVRGTYAVQAGTGFVTDSTGKALTIRLNLGQKAQGQPSAAAATTIPEVTF